jgi:hypothetical protein
MSDDIDILDQLINWRTVHLAHGGKLFEAAAAEIKQLREVIRCLVEQNATLSVCDGNVTVTMDATLTEDERANLEFAVDYLPADLAATIGNLLERLK